MTNDQLFAPFDRNHRQLMHCVDSLSETDLLFSPAGKWNAGRQLLHVYLCIKAMSKALGSKTFIEQSFGHIDRTVRSSEEILSWYREGIAAGGKSPERFEPGAFEPEGKGTLLTDMDQLLRTIQQQLDDYTAEELDTLALPHPFLGKLSIREFFFLMSEHPLIHLASIERALLHKQEVAAS